MRALVASTSLVAALVTAGCGSGKSEPPSWEGPPTANAQGIVRTHGFATFQDGVDEHWERSASMAAAEFLRLDARAAQTTSIEGRAPAEGTGPETVVVTLDGLPDDSVRSERWTLGFDEQDGVFTLTSARREQRCRPGRGHEDYAPGPCV